MRAAFDLAVKGIPTQEALKKNLQEIKILNLQEGKYSIFYGFFKTNLNMLQIHENL